jgi:hypothetical protein
MGPFQSIKAGFTAKRSIVMKLMTAVLILLTIFRIYLALNTPLILQGDAGYDDYLFIEYAKNFLNGEWLGDFSYISLAKSASYVWLLALGHLLGMPYPLLLIIFYIAAVITLCFALRNLIDNKIFLILTYVFLLYSPVMFHEENVQKIYRGGYIVVFALFIFAAVIGMYAKSVSDKAADVLKWSVLCSAAFPVFWFLKEDSVWILPFAACGAALAFIRVIWAGKGVKFILKRTLLLVCPFVVLAVSIGAYKYTNYVHYGEYAVTDRSDTYFSKMLSEIIKIEDEDVGDVWITKDMVYKALDASETFNTVRPQIDAMYGSGWIQENGEIGGDIIIWAMREAFRDAGVYDIGGAEADAFYEKIYGELSEAFEDGRLTESKDKIYLSPVARGYTFEELTDYYSDVTPVLSRCF